MKNHILGFCLLTATLFSTPTNGLTMDAGARAFDLQRDFAGGWYPNLQFTAGWGF